MQPVYDGYKGYAIDDGVGSLIIWLLVIFVVAIIALYAMEPVFVLRKAPEGKKKRKADGGKVLLTAFVFALFIVLFIFLLRFFTRK